MSYRIQDSLDQHRRSKREALQEQLRLLDEDERRAQLQYGNTSSSASSSSQNLPSTQHSWYQNDQETATTWADIPDHPRSDSVTSHTNRKQTSSYPRSQAWNPQPQAVNPPSQSSNHASSSQSRAQHSQHVSNATALRNYLSPDPANSSGKPAVPSQEQVHDYLRTHMGYKDGVYTNCSISGHSFDTYSLFTAVVRLGGSSKISRQNQWPVVAAALGVPAESTPTAGAGHPRSHARAAEELREFFLRLLGGLEILWEKTKGGSQQDFSLGQPPASSRRQAAPSTSPNMAPPGPSWQPQADGGPAEGYLPTPTTGRTFPAALQVQDLTHSKPKKVTKSFNPAGGSSTSTNNNHLYSASTGQQVNGNSDGARPTLSPVGQSYVQQTVYPAQLTSKRRSQSTRPTPAPASTSRSAASGPSLTAASTQIDTARSSQQTASSFAPPERQSNSFMESDPPHIATFDNLVESQALPLPNYGANSPLPTFMSTHIEYAWRAHELRTSIRKMSSQEPHRSILAEEIIWWNRLVLLLQKNPSVVIPKPPGSAQSAPTPRPPSPGPPLPTTIAPTSIHHLVQQPAGPAIPSIDPVASADVSPDPQTAGRDPTQKKKRVRNPKANLPLLEPGIVSQADANGKMIGANAAGQSVKKKRGRPPKDRTGEDPASTKRRPKKPKVAHPSSAVLDPAFISAAAGPTTSMTITEALSNGAEAASSLAGGLSRDQGQSSTPAADFLQMIYARQNALPQTIGGPVPLSDLSTTPISSLRPTDGQTEATPVRGAQGSPAQRVDPQGKVIPTVMSEARSKAAKERWERLRAEKLAGPPPPPPEPVLIYGPYTESGEVPVVVKKRKPYGPRAKRIIDDGRPVFLRAPSVVDSASPKRILHLGERVSHAFISERDAKTPTKISTKRSKLSKPLLRRRPDLQTDGEAGPLSETEPSTLAESTIIEIEDNDEIDDSPFLELSQSFAPPSPPKPRSKPFVDYVAPGARKDEVPDAAETDLRPILGNSEPILDPEAVEIMEKLVEQLNNSESVEFTKTKGKGKGNSRGRASMVIPETTLESELENVELTPTAPGAKGKGTNSAKGKKSQNIVEVVLPVRATPLTKQVAPSSQRSTRSQPSPAPANTTPSKTPSNSVAPERTLPSSHGKSSLRNEVKRLKHSPPPSSQSARGAEATPTMSNLARSRGGPLAAALQSRPNVDIQTKKVGRKTLYHAPRAASIHSSSVVFVPSIKGKAKASLLRKSISQQSTFPSATRPNKRKVETEEEWLIAKRRTMEIGLVDRVKVSLPIADARRTKLILSGYYDPFRDDDSDDEDLTRHAHIPLRPSKSTRGSRPIRPTEPEDIPLRFLHRPGPALVEPFKSVLSESTLLRRLTNSPCEWKGCSAVLASEVLLQKHVNFNRHTSEASSKTGPFSQTLWRCHWRECESSCFTSEAALSQHLTARHISRNLTCPFGACDLTSPNISHLSRHAMKQHESDDPRPLADLSERIEPPKPVQALPEIARTDELTTQRIPGSIYTSQYRRDWAIARVADNCFGGDDPIMHVEHAPHMLEAAATSEEEKTTDNADEEGDANDMENDLYNANEMDEQRAADRKEGKPSRWQPVILVPSRSALRSGSGKVGGTAEEPIVLDDDEVSGDESDEIEGGQTHQENQDGGVLPDIMDEAVASVANTPAEEEGVSTIQAGDAEPADVPEAVDQTLSTEGENANPDTVKTPVGGSSASRKDATEEGEHQDTPAVQSASETSAKEDDDETMDEDEVLALTTEGPQIDSDAEGNHEQLARIVWQEAAQDMGLRPAELSAINNNAADAIAKSLPANTMEGTMPSTAVEVETFLEKSANEANVTSQSDDQDNVVEMAIELDLQQASATFLESDIPATVNLGENSTPGAFADVVDALAKAQALPGSAPASFSDDTDAGGANAEVPASPATDEIAKITSEETDGQVQPEIPASVLATEGNLTFEEPTSDAAAEPGSEPEGEISLPKTLVHDAVGITGVRKPPDETQKDSAIQNETTATLAEDMIGKENVVEFATAISETAHDADAHQGPTSAVSRADSVSEEGEAKVEESMEDSVDELVGKPGERSTDDIVEESVTEGVA